MQQSAELKTKLESAEGNACARADEATRIAREEAEKCEKAAAHRLCVVANSPSGMPMTGYFFVELVTRFWLLKLLLLSVQGTWAVLLARAASPPLKTWMVP